MATQAVVEDREAGSSDAVLALVQPVLARKGRPAAGVDQDLREAGMSSLDTVNLMLAVEAAFDLFIPEAEMTPENFRSVRTVAALVDRLR